MPSAGSFRAGAGPVQLRNLRHLRHLRMLTCTRSCRRGTPLKLLGAELALGEFAMPYLALRVEDGDGEGACTGPAGVRPLGVAAIPWGSCGPEAGRGAPMW